MQRRYDDIAWRVSSVMWHWSVTSLDPSHTITTTRNNTRIQTPPRSPYPSLVIYSLSTLSFSLGALVTFCRHFGSTAISAALIKWADTTSEKTQHVFSFVMRLQQPGTANGSQSCWHVNSCHKCRIATNYQHIPAVTTAHEAAGGGGGTWTL